MSKMKKMDISRKQFLTGSATMLMTALLGKLSGNVYAEGEAQDNKDFFTTETAWEQLPIDILPGACLIDDTKSNHFGGTYEKESGLLTQYIHVYPGLKLVLSSGNADTVCWIGYSRQLKPLCVFRKGENHNDKSGDKKNIRITVSENVYFLRGSCDLQDGTPQISVKCFAEYALACGLGRPDLSSYTEITKMTCYQHSRDVSDARFDNRTFSYPTLGDVFFSPVGTDIIVTFNNANIAPYIYCGSNCKFMDRRMLFSQHYGFGYSWFHCKTIEICNWLGASYETINGCAKMLPLQDLQNAEPHFYIRFPSHVTNTTEAARIRTKGVKSNYERLFTVVHLTDVHGDVDSAHAAYEYADLIGADFAALTGDFVPTNYQHGFDILHSIIRTAHTPTVFSLGNHDISSFTDEKVYKKEIAPIKDSLLASDEHPYYYRDFAREGETVRAISLYPFDDRAKTRKKAYYTSEQLSWLCEAMASVPDGGHIFILRHFAHHKPVLPDAAHGMFYYYPESDTDVKISDWLNMDEDPITDIVDAYNKREKIISHYIGNLKEDKETVTVAFDFSNRPASEFVAYFTGHIHVDAVGYARNTKTRQAVLCSICTTAVKGSAEYHSFADPSTPRDYGTDSQIALNVFTFDFKKKSIYVARVGNGVFKDQVKTWMELPYGI